MINELNQDPAPYYKMKEDGAEPREVFEKAKADGYKNFECIALISGLFEIPLNNARQIAHAIHQEKK